MITYKTELVEHREVDRIICDCCLKELTDIIERQESYQLGFVGGYGSVFGDGNYVRCDLCQHCLKLLVGQFFRIEPLEE